MKDFLKKSGWTHILVSIVFAIIGIFMISNTNLAIKIISYIIGGTFIAFGVIKVVDYFVLKDSCDFYNYDLLYGIIAIIIGVITIIYSGLIESMLRIMIGIWIIYTGLLRLSMSLKLHKADADIWIMSLILSIIMIIGGIYIILQNGVLILTVGIIMLVYSVIDLIESIIFIKNVNELFIEE